MPSAAVGRLVGPGWQADITYWLLADGTGVEILDIVDDHSRFDIASDARITTTGTDVVASFRRASAATDPGPGAQRQRCRLHRQATPRRPGHLGTRAGPAMTNLSASDDRPTARAP
jgi:hypothetical protein